MVLAHEQCGTTSVTTDRTKVTLVNLWTSPSGIFSPFCGAVTRRKSAAVSQTNSLSEDNTVTMPDRTYSPSSSRLASSMPSLFTMVQFSPIRAFLSTMVLEMVDPAPMPIGTRL